MDQIVSFVIHHFCITINVNTFGPFQKCFFCIDRFLFQIINTRNCFQLPWPISKRLSTLFLYVICSKRSANVKWGFLLFRQMLIQLFLLQNKTETNKNGYFLGCACRAPPVGVPPRKKKNAADESETLPPVLTVVPRDHVVRFCFFSNHFFWKIVR